METMMTAGAPTSVQTATEATRKSGFMTTGGMFRLRTVRIAQQRWRGETNG